MANQHQPDEPSEPHILRPLGRMLLHGSQIAFFFALHWGIEALAHWTGQDKALWARIAIGASAVMFDVSLILIGGMELIGDCWEAGRVLRRRIRG